MIDAHVHVFHGNSGKYSIELIESFARKALDNGVKEIHMLEHTHQFYEFEPMYKPIGGFNEYQKNWLSGKMKASLDSYMCFIEAVEGYSFPIKVKFGLEACFIPETGHILEALLKKTNWDFVVGAVHYIDNWGFDHKSEFWQGVDIEAAYKRYYEIMLEMINTGLFNGVAHPDSIKCFGYYPQQDLHTTYVKLAEALNEAGMYAEQSGGLALNYDSSEMGMNTGMLEVFKANNVQILTASDAHIPEHAGANIRELMNLLLDN